MRGLFAPFHGDNTDRIPSGTPNLFNNLQSAAHLFPGAKRNTFAPEFAVHFSRNTCFSRISDLFSKAQKGTTAAIAACGSAATRTRSTEQPNDITLSFAFVKRDCLGIRVQCDSTGGVPNQSPPQTAALKSGRRRFNSIPSHHILILKRL
jgi:hypothetical protein